MGLNYAAECVYHPLVRIQTPLRTWIRWKSHRGNIQSFLAGGRVNFSLGPGQMWQHPSELLKSNLVSESWSHLVLQHRDGLAREKLMAFQVLPKNTWLIGGTICLSSSREMS